VVAVVEKKVVVEEQVDIENLFQILQQEVYQFQYKVIQLQSVEVELDNQVLLLLQHQDQIQFFQQ
jgi:hypothetical protein